MFINRNMIVERTFGLELMYRKWFNDSIAGGKDAESGPQSRAPSVRYALSLSK